MREEAANKQLSHPSQPPSSLLHYSSSALMDGQSSTTMADSLGLDAVVSGMIHE